MELNEINDRDAVMLNYYDKLHALLEKSNVFSELDTAGSVPLEFWEAFAQVIADIGEYRVALQAAIYDGTKIQGWRDVVVAEPACYIKVAT